MAEQNQIGLFGTYSDIKVKNGEIKITMTADLNGNLDKIEALANGAETPVMLGIQFRQTELEVDK